eukprot:CAMPEP_0182448398 /NCGR_PEP_ID=MMETSP1172-20130603/26692_1 /TAXON_ID=708627 /ORGANISM="Timspurckia oligopyrenoides, Strain CCMP3278" /LENGTH=266 /DNA_ID=CAMNT_0024645257 /DNA_START=263 /DNA_END=1059 /DNA_ORIENTATION=+
MLYMLIKFIKNSFAAGKVWIKNISELSELERIQLQEIVQRYYPTAQPEYIHDRTRADNGYELALLKNDMQILGVNYFHVATLLTPFVLEPVPVIHFGQAMKHEMFKGDVIWRLGTIFCLKRVGMFFFFQKLVGVSTIVSPRVYEKFKQRFPVSVDSVTQPHGRVVLCFLNHYFQSERRTSITVDDDFCYNYSTTGEDDITDDWESYYCSKDKAINAMFFERGILSRRNNRIYKSGKHLVAFGYRIGRKRNVSVQLVHNFACLELET